MPPLAVVNIFLLGMSQIVGCCRTMVTYGNPTNFEKGVPQLRCTSRMAAWTSSRVEPSEITFFKAFRIALCACQ